MNKRWPSCSSSARNFCSIGNASGESSQSFSAKRPSLGKALRMMSILSSLTCIRKQTSNAQRPTSNTECRPPDSTFGVFCLSTVGHFLQRELHQFFRRLGLTLRLQIANGFVRVGLFVTERDQRQNRFVCLFLLRRRRVRGGRSFPGSRHPKLVFQFENDSLGRFFAEPADLRNCRDIGIDDGRFEIRHAHSTQNC